MLKPTITLLVLLTATTMQAQFGGPSYFLPKDCQSAAQGSANSTAAGSILVAIINGAYETTLGADTINTCMRLSDGKAIAWIYTFYQPNGDSVFFKPFAKIFVCIDAASFLPAGSIPAPPLGREAVPSAYIQGDALITALNKDGDYTAYHAAYPQHNPDGTALTVSREPVLDYPAGTPFWFLTWSPSPGNSGMTCFVHALSSETICVRVTSVADDAVAAGFSVAPNPAFDQATLMIPMSWMGSTATIEAIDATGSLVVLRSDVLLTSPALNLSLSSLPSGMYTVRIRNERQAIVIPMSVVR